MGANGARLVYIDLPALIELKLAAGRGRDESDVIELMRENMNRADEIRGHLTSIHGDYATAFEACRERRA